MDPDTLQRTKLLGLCCACGAPLPKDLKPRWGQKCRDCKHATKQSGRLAVAIRSMDLRDPPLTIDDAVRLYENLVKQQGGKCFICHMPPSDGTRLSIDHDHRTGEIRALLCKRCNTGIGYFRDNPALLLAAAFYTSKGLVGKPFND